MSSLGVCCESMLRSEDTTAHNFLDNTEHLSDERGLSNFEPSHTHTPCNDIVFDFSIVTKLQHPAKPFQPPRPTLGRSSPPWAAAAAPRISRGASTQAMGRGNEERMAFALPTLRPTPGLQIRWK